MFSSNAEVAHRWFDGHAAHFAEGIKGLLDAHATLEPWGMSFLSKAAKAITAKAPILKAPIQKALPVTTKTTTSDYRYDVAFSFAGTERTLVEEIATILKDNGFNVFYDNFYPEQLWGKDLVATFDRIYRKESRYCIMFLSQEYADRMWTTHERRSATARALQEKGNEYILPVKIDDVDIDGLAPTLGYVSAASYSAQKIADLLMSKLKG
ncbi:TIR domain-containing protein [Methylotenera sp.]|uniref:TIR domain-containing protein n=1 Tax=Methylotenera sp. TaxID=2051956 RepID=UPI0027366A19|nr:TIR domain-containing protein [Methylotenera sp.]MDP3006063.1 TIR domain-containing protein [Methylotenera sp.]